MLIYLLGIIIFYILFMHFGKKTAQAYFEKKWKDDTEETCFARLQKINKVNKYCFFIMIVVAVVWFFVLPATLQTKYEWAIFPVWMMLVIPDILVRGAAEFVFKKFPPKADV